MESDAQGLSYRPALSLSPYGRQVSQQAPFNHCLSLGAVGCKFASKEENYLQAMENHLL